MNKSKIIISIWYVIVSVMAEVTITKVPANFDTLKNQMLAMNPPVTYFEVTNGQICKACI